MLTYHQRAWESFLASQGMFAATSIVLIALSTQALTNASAPAPSVPVESPSSPELHPKPHLKSTRVPLTIAAVNAAVFGGELSLKATGSEVLRLEILLDRAKYSPGEMDGFFGNNLAHTVVAYRRAHALSLDPIVDAQVWDLLNADRAPLFVDYVLTKNDVVPTGVSVPRDMLSKARLKRLGYASSAELLGEKFHISPKILAELNPGVDLDQVGTTISAPNVATQPPPKPASLCINATDLTLQGLDATGHILMSYPVSVGSKHDPLPPGQLKIVSIHLNPVYSYDSIHFWDSKGPRSKAKIPPGPNNPVGIAWLGLSRNHYGIHGTPSPGLIGRGQSHGCIRMTNWDVTELSGVVATDLNVVLKTE